MNIRTQNRGEYCLLERGFGGGGRGDLFSKRESLFALSSLLEGETYTPSDPE